MAAMKAGLAYACALVCVIVALASPAFADDADLKKEVEQSNSAFMVSFNRQDVAGLAAMYASSAIIVGQKGARTDIAQFYEATFKAGINRIETTVDQAWPLGSDAALGMGRFRITGKDQSGAPIDVAALWTATYVREGGEWKVRMSSVIQQPPAK